MTRAQPTPQLAAALLLLPLLLLAPVEVTASTLAVAGGSAVCGVAADNGTVYCVAAYNSSASPVAPYLVFSQVSGGAGFLCGVGAVPGGGGGVHALFCWPPAAPGQLRRVYRGPDLLLDVAVGADHVAAYDGQARGIRWWRGGSGAFPTDLVQGAFGSLVSGDGFTCAMDAGSAVRCWGTRACGVVSATGAVLCAGAGAGVLPQSGLEPHGLAVGDSHACGLRRNNHTAVCWSLAGPTPTVYYPAYGTEFVFLVAGGNLTCGLVTANFTVLCWSSSSTSSAAYNEAVMVALPAVLPGSCVPDGSSCQCGVFPRSAELCTTARAGGGVICNRVCPPPPPPPAAPASPPESPASKRVSKVWIAFAVVGAVGVFAGICSIIYCFVFGFCSHKRIHNSVQPNIASNAPAAAVDNAGGVVVGAGAAASPYGSPNGSRARGLFRRQLSRAMTRQRSGPSSFNFKEHTEEYTFAQLATATNGFAPEAKIGAGSFGTVYRGKLADGREVAIKRGEASGPMARKFQEKESAFRSELAFLSRLHHKHLVGLVGYCDEKERLLVYEYMKNGALYHLHPKGGGADADAIAASPVASSWKLRIKILLDASRGIEYLHSYAVPPIIHRDIKSSNILLDGGWVARVSDFGLSLMGPPEAEEAGGAAAPVHEGCRHDGEAEGGGPVSVVDYAQPSIVAGELGKVLDGRAPEPSPHEAEAVELVAYTAVHCVRLEGKDRPARAAIVANLETAFALCEGSAGGSRGGAGGGTAGGGFGNSSSSASLSMTSMELSGRLAE
ncbi:hypothetical protein ZWY2020_037606 [Hordeum vulgare]|nr:hypothetical protein ZWY2020_037606 [Hordeum vulgare]